MVVARRSGKASRNAWQPTLSATSLDTATPLFGLSIQSSTIRRQGKLRTVLVFAIDNVASLLEENRLLNALRMVEHGIDELAIEREHAQAQVYLAVLLSQDVKLRLGRQWKDDVPPICKTVRHVVESAIEWLAIGNQPFAVRCERNDQDMAAVLQSVFGNCFRLSPNRISYRISYIGSTASPIPPQTQRALQILF